MKREQGRQCKWCGLFEGQGAKLHNVADECINTGSCRERMSDARIDSLEFGLGHVTVERDAAIERAEKAEAERDEARKERDRAEALLAIAQADAARLREALVGVLDEAGVDHENCNCGWCAAIESARAALSGTSDE